MDNFLKPQRFDVDPNDPNASKLWLHWYQTFDNFIGVVNTAESSVNKLNLLTNYISANVYEHIADCKAYDEANKLLESCYLQPKNEVYARHVLATRRQEPHEPIEQYLQTLKLLAKDCEFKAVNGDTHRDQYIREAFISGLSSAPVRQRLLENSTLDLKTAFEQARSLTLAQKHAESFNSIGYSSAICDDSDTQQYPHSAAVPPTKPVAKCYFCGLRRHARNNCPAKDALCHTCGKKGHFSKVCRSGSSSAAVAATPTVAAVTAAAP